MHELSIVETLIDLVEKEVQQADRKRGVLRLDLVIGRLSGVNPDSIRFAFQVLGPGTLLANAAIHIAEPKAVCHCHHCAARTEINDWVVLCPECESNHTTVEGGQELLLHTIELED